jgi:glucosamine--fructose-6-phosphate aminotransferase (isomerizing)
MSKGLRDLRADRWRFGSDLRRAHDAPLILGVGEGEHYIASDIPAILNRTRDVIFLEQRETAVVGKELQISTPRARLSSASPERIMWDAVMAKRAATSISC